MACSIDLIKMSVNWLADIFRDDLFPEISGSIISFLIHDPSGDILASIKCISLSLTKSDKKATRIGSHHPPMPIVITQLTL